MTEKIEVFTDEINSIENKYIKNITIDILKDLPSYFWEIPASSSGKYHPQYATGNGGLVRHVKAAVKIANSLFEIFEFNQINQDIIISALLLHDGLKCGLNKEKHTVFNHPTLMRDFILNKYKNNNNSIIIAIANCVASHMGKWNIKHNIVLPLPKTERENFVHVCDFLASRKFINIDFEA